MTAVRETGIRAIDYGDDNQATLYLAYPNIQITMPADEVRDPQKVRFRVTRKFGPRHELNGISFFELAAGRCQRRWEALLDEAPMVSDFTLKEPPVFGLLEPL